MTFCRLASTPPGGVPESDSTGGSASHATLGRRLSTGRPIGLWIWLASALAVALFISSLPLGWDIAHGQAGTGTGAGPLPPLANPQDIRISNVTYAGFAISWTTTDPTAGYACYWKVADGPQAAQPAYDVNGLTQGRVHYVNIGLADDMSPPLEPGTWYAGGVRSGSPGSSPCADAQESGRVQTPNVDGVPPAPFSVRGTIGEPGGVPVDAVVYLRARNAGGQSSLLSARLSSFDGSWTIPLANARTDLSAASNVVTVDGYWPLATTDRIDVEAWASPEVTDRAGNIAVGTTEPAVVSPLQLGARRLALKAGFNLVSFNVVPANTAIGNVLAPIADNVVGVNSFDALSTNPPPGARSYYPDLATLSDLQQMDRQHGYWVNVASDTVLYLSGSTSDSREVPLAAGWNLVSYLPNQPMPVAAALSSVLTDTIRVEGPTTEAEQGIFYDSSWDAPAANVMRPGRAYWIKMAVARTLIYPPSAQ